MERTLGGTDAAVCGEAFSRLKLSFVHGLVYDSFLELPPTERARVLREGYAAYREWLLGQLSFSERAATGSSHDR